MSGDYPLWFILFFVFLFGSVFGSFLNVCIHRFPKYESTGRFSFFRDAWTQIQGVWGRSNCPRCDTEILARDNIPILGWLMLRGKCRSCKMPISGRYPLVELCNGLLFVLVYLFELPSGLETYWDAQCCVEPELGPQKLGSVWGTTAIVWMHLRYLFHMVLIEALVVATFIDLETYLIPDGCTMPPLVFAVIASTVLGQMFLVPVWFASVPNHNTITGLLPDSLAWMVFDFDAIKFARAWPYLHGFLVSFVGLIVGAGTVIAVRVIGQKVLRKEAMGMGDVTLMAAIGSFIGWQPVVVVFFLAPLCAMVVVIFASLTGWKKEIPYGPYLSLATLLLLLFWKQIWPLAHTYFDLGVGIFFVAIFMCVAMFVLLWIMQIGKRLLGIPLYEEDVVDAGWSSADTLHYLAGESIDEQQGQWKRPGWEGSLSGRGLNQNDVWRNGR